MPAYGTLQVPNVPTCLFPGDQLDLWKNEQPAPGTASLPAALAMKEATSLVTFSIELFFAAAPGVFAVDIEVADTDQDAFYQKLDTLNTVDANNHARNQYVAVEANFVRARMTTRTNAVNGTVRLSR